MSGHWVCPWLCTTTELGASNPSSWSHRTPTSPSFSSSNTLLLLPPSSLRGPTSLELGDREVSRYLRTLRPLFWVNVGAQSQDCFCRGTAALWSGHNSGKSLPMWWLRRSKGMVPVCVLSLRLPCQRRSGPGKQAGPSPPTLDSKWPCWHYNLSGLLCVSPPIHTRTNSHLSSSRKSLLTKLSLKPLSGCWSTHSYIGQSFWSPPRLGREDRFQWHSMCGPIAGLARILCGLR